MTLPPSGIRGPLPTCVTTRESLPRPYPSTKYVWRSGSARIIPTIAASASPFVVSSVFAAAIAFAAAASFRKSARFVPTSSVNVDVGASALPPTVATSDRIPPSATKELAGGRTVDRAVGDDAVRDVELRLLDAR